MSYYSRDVIMTPKIDTSKNICLLRCDLHKDFDRRAFAIVPKPASGTVPALTVHFLRADNDLADQVTKFHNQIVRSLDSLSPQYLFARFAYAIFALVTDFVLHGTGKRRLALKTEGTDSVGADELTISVHDMNLDQRNDLFGSGGTRSSSPQKRSRGVPSLESGSVRDHDEDERLGLPSPDEHERRRRKRVRDWILKSDHNDTTSESPRKRRIMATETLQ